MPVSIYVTAKDICVSAFNTILCKDSIRAEATRSPTHPIYLIAYSHCSVNVLSKALAFWVGIHWHGICASLTVHRVIHGGESGRGKSSDQL